MYKLLLGNCIDVMQSMPDKSVDCIITDMPYGVGVDFGDYRDNVENLEALIDVALPEMRRVAHRTIITPGVRNMYLYPEPTWTLAWCFGGGARGRWGFNHWQPVLAYGADPLHRLSMVHTDVVRANNATLEARIEHPCPKPLPFMRKLINRVAPSPADTILDPFLGSGTTGVAAVQLGHDFVGVELHGDYLVLAERRIAAARPDFNQTINLTATEAE